MKKQDIITSCGIVKNPEKPRVGVKSINNLPDWIYDEIDNGINISMEEYILDLEKQGLSEEDIEKHMDMYESDNDTILLGDWEKINNKYVIDKNGKNGYAATYNNGQICVEYSKTTKKCNVTSPCYVMADGTGPCANLDDTSTNIVIGYDFPIE